MACGSNRLSASSSFTYVATRLAAPGGVFTITPWIGGSEEVADTRIDASLAALEVRANTPNGVACRRLSSDNASEMCVGVTSIQERRVEAGRRAANVRSVLHVSRPAAAAAAVVIVGGWADM